ncbi:hypothetical protein [Hansschlegelia beijingensis]|uniref:Uncharacterized protein n=1 Tax=Hansschlegelia beijingensis TaxID=1133344 RepID=A0A7W6GF08_9HYPH|nr:hypothetical protein [Hansschlegelia beijingensis]MBB3972800.1 hypothetical protein [Hansschlegelia beijingensis]
MPGFIGRLWGHALDAVRPQVDGVSANRKIEWYAAFNLLAGGVMFALPGYTLATKPVYEPLVRAGWTDASMAALFTGVGTAWCLALYANGHWRRSPLIRCVGALAGTIIWGQVAALHVVNGWATGTPNLGSVTYGLLAGFCLAACSRAAADFSITRRRDALHP